MDTISRENNNYLPIAGVIVGVVAFALGAIALAKISTLNKNVPEGLAEAVQKIDMIESEARSATSAVERANTNITTLGRQTNDAFMQAAAQIQEVRGEVAKLQESAKAPAARAAASKSPAVAGPGEYVVKSNDSGAKIARANGISLSDLMAVNPGVNWNKIRPGDKLKLPKK